MPTELRECSKERLAAPSRRGPLWQYIKGIPPPCGLIFNFPPARTVSIATDTMTTQPQLEFLPLSALIQRPSQSYITVTDGVPLLHHGEKIDALIYVDLTHGSPAKGGISEAAVISGNPSSTSPTQIPTTLAPSPSSSAGVKKRKQLMAPQTPNKRRRALEGAVCDECFEVLDGKAECPNYCEPEPAVDSLSTSEASGAAPPGPATALMFYDPLAIHQRYVAKRGA